MLLIAATLGDCSREKRLVIGTGRGGWDLESGFTCRNDGCRCRDGTDLKKSLVSTRSAPKRAFTRSCRQRCCRQRSEAFVRMFCFRWLSFLFFVFLFSSLVRLLRCARTQMTVKFPEDTCEAVMDALVSSAKSMMGFDKCNGGNK